MALKPASEISRALIAAAAARHPSSRSWTSSLDQTLHNLIRRGSLSPDLVADVIHPHLNRHPNLALGFFNWASQQPNFTPSSQTYQSLLKSISFSRQFSAISNLLKQIRARRISLHPSVYRSIIGSQIVGGKVKEAFEVFRDLCDAGFFQGLGEKICNSLLAALASEGEMDSALKVFDEMCVRGLRFSTLGFGVMIWRFCGSCGMNEVLGLLDRARGVGKWDDVNGSIVAGLIVQGMCRGRRVSEAVLMLEELRIRGCKPDFMAYREVVEGLRAGNDVVEVMRVNKMKRKLGVAPRSSDYYEFIFELVAERKVREAKELGEMIVEGKFPLSNEVLNALIGSVSAVDPACAIGFFNFLIRNEKLPTLLTVKNLSNNLVKHGKADELLMIFEILKTREFFEDMESYKMLVFYLCKAGKVREAYAVLQDMKREGLGPETESYNVLMEACCREDLIRPAKKLWDEMFASGCCGDLSTYSILIQKFIEIGEVEEAQQLFNHMLLKEVAPDATVYRVLLHGLCQQKNIEAAFETFAKSAEQDLLVAQTILSSFILYLCKEGFTIAASKFLLSVRSDIGHLDSHVTLLRFLADAGEVPLAIKHIRGISKSSPKMIKPINAELLGSLSSATTPSPILQMLQAIQEASSTFNGDKDTSNYFSEKAFGLPLSK